ncbi:ImmA/IrrE family metallo-endopeptidase [Paenibacillus sp. FSL P4-0176]|uniref:ImmA/IrrE family metallo-endopeptidase n=1 Tax=Paenibacillus sp. FSL P4-0176 TaxID=2921631 RepID=UPI0030CFE8F8
MSRVPYISAEEMEDIALNILTDYGFDFENMVLPMATPIEEIIEFHFELDFAWEPIDHFDLSGIVMAAILPGQKRIIMNESRKELFEEKIGTMNFTMAHELGHWVLHVNDKDNLQTSLNLNKSKEVFYCRSHSTRPPVEQQADMFAGAILMPKPALEKFVGKLKATRNIDMGSLYTLAGFFKVSISALCVRLNRLELLYVHKGQVYNSKEEYDGQIAFEF